MPAVDASTRPTGTTPGSPKPGSPALHQSEEHNHDQFHPLRRIILSDEIDAELLKTDPFFLLASVLRTSLLSWCQLLNLIGEKVSQAQNQLELTYEELELDLIQLRYHMQIIHAANENLSESLKMVERGGCPEWPQARSDAAKARKKDIQEQLRIDYLHVMDRCSLMIRQCTSSSAVLVGFAQLTTAEKGSQQAAEIHSLTRLATVFIPLSFSASVFGMNVTETDPTVSIAWFFGLATVLVAVTFAVVFWASLKSLFRRISRSMEEKPRF
jgi:Mg2+ and Co2+ transporter CorA